MMMQCDAVQGTIDSRRRNYDGAFAAMRADAVLARLQMLNESLLLVGKQNGNLTLPSDLINRIRVVSGDIPYQVGATVASRMLQTPVPTAAHGACRTSTPFCDVAARC